MTKQRVDLLLKIFIGILCIIPIISFYLLTNSAAQQGVELGTLLKNDIEVNVRLLSVFTLPFIGFLINFYRKKVPNEIAHTEVIINYILFALTLSLVGYLSFGVLLLVLTYAMYNAYDFEKINWKSIRLGNISAGIVAVIFGALIVFLQYRAGI